MRLAILGGGGFRTPLVYGALLTDRHERRVDEVRLHDVARSGWPRSAGSSSRWPRATTTPRVTTTTDLDEAVGGAEFVFSAIRVGGLEGALPTSASPSTSACSARRPPARADCPTACAPSRGPARRRAGAGPGPGAWVINFTNPAGLITEAMQSVLGDRVVGICDSPIGLGRRVATLGLDPAQRRRSTTSA